MTFQTSEPLAREDDAGGPHLPVFRTWRGVYFFVAGAYVLYVVLLAAWTRWFA